MSSWKTELAGLAPSMKAYAETACADRMELMESPAIFWYITSLTTGTTPGGDTIALKRICASAARVLPLAAVALGAPQPVIWYDNSGSNDRLCGSEYPCCFGLDKSRQARKSDDRPSACQSLHIVSVQSNFRYSVTLLQRLLTLLA